MRQLLRERHRLVDDQEDDFTIRNLTALANTAAETTAVMSLMLGAIASISLVVGGIGVMNIMLVSVSERVSEIGVRMALGAAPIEVLRMILSRAGVYLATGMAIGLAIGYVIILARKFTINQSDSTYGADVMMGAGNSSGRFLGPLIILSAMGASIPIGIGSLLGALLFYIWEKPITGGAILGAMLFGTFFPIALA